MIWWIIWTRSSIFYYLIDMNVCTLNLPVFNSGQHSYVMGLCNFFFVLQDLIDRINSYFQRDSFSEELASYWPLTLCITSFFQCKWAAFTGMALHKLERRNYNGKSAVSIKYQNLHSFKEGLILWYHSILETRRITHLHGSAHFTISLKVVSATFLLVCFLCLKGGTCETKKNVFYFTGKVLFVLEKIKF